MQAIDRRERLRRLALETIDLSKDPYFMRNHLGQYECRLCLTLHNNEGNYLAHTQVSLLNTSLQSSFLNLQSTFHSACCMTVWCIYETWHVLPHLNDTNHCMCRMMTSVMISLQT